MAVTETLHMTRRFASSAINVLYTLYDAYELYIQCFEDNRQSDDDCEEMKYKVKGNVLDLSLMPKHTQIIYLL